MILIPRKFSKSYIGVTNGEHQEDIGRSYIFALGDLYLHHHLASRQTGGGVTVRARSPRCSSSDRWSPEKPYSDNKLWSYMIMGFIIVQVVCKIILEDTCNSKSPSFTMFIHFFSKSTSKKSLQNSTAWWSTWQLIPQLHRRSSKSAGVEPGGLKTTTFEGRILLFCK